MKRPVQNIAHSIHVKLLSLAKAQNEDFQNFLMLYALERLLYRLSLTPHRDRFVLKGAMLFAIWSHEPHRPTQDLDLLGFGNSSISELENVFREICEVAVDEDGLQFQASTVKGRAIREDKIYDGVRINLKATLGKAVIPLQIDVGFGDAPVPAPNMIEYPATLGLPAAKLRAYHRETVIAEKFNAMVELGLSNTRLKDFYDVWALANSCDFEGEVLAEAIKATFARRRTPLPTTAPVALTSEFASEQVKQNQWRAFMKRGKLRAGDVPLEEIVSVLHGFLMPVVESVNAGSEFNQRWKAGGSWGK
jgi:predicted nucleotidyltransferase component of viral defense system